MKITASTPVAGVLGCPIKHSKSPRLHNHWLNTLGLDGVYVAFEVHPDKLATVLEGARAMGVKGLNLTVPLKELAVSLCDEMTPAAKSIGAVNTLVFKDDCLLGDNTDGYGFITHLRSTATNWDASQPALILGAGGAARAALFALLDAGIPKVMVANRTLSRATDLATEFGNAVEAVPWSEIHSISSDVGLLANTTVLGMTGQPALEVNLTHSREDCVVYDIVYSPLETPLLKQARDLNRTAVHGLGMLIHQAVPAFTQFFGKHPPVTAELETLMLKP